MRMKMLDAVHEFIYYEYPDGVFPSPEIIARGKEFIILLVLLTTAFIRDHGFRRRVPGLDDI